MSQFDEVSNIANPTFDAELAISMTVNAKLPKTPQSRTAGASDLAVDSLDNKIPIGRARNWVATTCPISRPNGEQRAEFQGAAVRKATATDRCGCSKSGLQRIRTNLVCAGRHLNRICASSFMLSHVRLLVSANRAATNSTNFASVWQFLEQNSANVFESEQPSPACYGVRK
jgi:hypothetical protein